MAQNCQDSQIAARLRIIAADYLDAQVGDKATQRQQQVRFKKESLSLLATLACQTSRHFAANCEIQNQSD